MRPSDELRAAAARIRGIAGRATPGPWLNLDHGDRIIRDPDATAAEDDSDPCGEGPPLEYVIDEPLSYPNNGDHIVLWDPLRADIVAELLEAIANLPKPSHVDVVQISLLGQVLARAINSAEVKHDA